MNSVQKLREATGAGVMDCKRALDDAKGDFAAALKLIEERGHAKAAKRADRETGAGVLESYIHQGRVGVLLDLRSETDFVANADPFRALAHELAMQIAAMNPGTVDELLAEPYIKDAGMTVHDVVKSAMAKLGENIRVNRFTRYEL
ncbi:MAG: translation elongation factor Ts [Patescibacteria group bacterium]